MVEKKERELVEKESIEASIEKAKIIEKEKKRRLSKEEKKRIEIIKAFANEVLKLYGDLVKSVVLFGSTARGDWKKESDIDVFVIIDDTKQNITPSFRDKMEEEFDKIARKLSDKLSVQQPYLLTEFWNMVRIGHPIIFNFIREGIPIYDRDVFTPIKRLLQMGEIKPSREAVEKYMERAPKRIERIESSKLYMVAEDCYYAMLETAQAVLMFFGASPPKPADAPDELRKNLVKLNILKPEYADWLEGVINLRKDIEHRKINKISGKELDEWIEKAKKFIDEMQKVLIKIELIKRENIIEKSYTIMAETALTLMNALGKKVGKDDDILKAFEEYLVKPGIVSDVYLEAFSTLCKMKKKMEEGKITELPKQDILIHREYVRKFINEAGKILKKRGKMQEEFAT
jgi:predicted nucleotidyltransferase/uncharacterized protein (UPF0332 family)